MTYLGTYLLADHPILSYSDGGELSSSYYLLESGRERRLADSALYLVSDNEEYQPEMIIPQQMGEVEILGRCEVRIGRVI